MSTPRGGVVAVVPARSGSKGVVDKNVRPLGDHPLITYSIVAGLRAPGVHRVMVSTDSEAYAELSRNYGAEVPFLRPAAYATDRSTDLEFVLHLLDWLFEHGGTEPELLVHLRPTTPLRDPAVVGAAVMAFRANPEATALRSVHAMSESAYKGFEIEGDHLVTAFHRASALDAANAARQGFPTTYVANGYVDVLRTDFIRSTGLLHGDRVLAWVTEPVTEVDTAEDFEYLNWQANRDPNLIRRIFEAR